MIQTIFSHLLEELFVALLSAEEGNHKDACAIQGKQSPDALRHSHISITEDIVMYTSVCLGTTYVEFTCKYLEDNKGKTELAKRSPDVGSLNTQIIIPLVSENINRRTSNVLCAARISTNSSFVRTTYVVGQSSVEDDHRKQQSSHCALGGVSDGNDYPREPVIVIICFRKRRV